MFTHHPHSDEGGRACVDPAAAAAAAVFAVNVTAAALGSCIM